MHPRSIHTTRCRAHQHREFVLECDRPELPQENLHELAEQLEAAVAGGQRFAAGQLLPVGFGLLRVVDEQDVLAFEEPDFAGLPLTWKRGVGHTLLQRAVQRLCAEGLGVSPSFPSLLQKAECCPAAAVGSFTLERRGSERADASGFRLFCGDEAHEHFGPDAQSRPSLYELSVRRPSLLRFFALPEGSRVSLGPLGPSFFVQGEARAPLRDSYLAKLLEGPRGKDFVLDPRRDADLLGLLEARRIREVMLGTAERYLLSIDRVREVLTEAAKAQGASDEPVS